ncbi:MAG: hypothetical protein ABIN17_02695 [candidate division WOR-3 bacterium]
MPLYLREIRFLSLFVSIFLFFYSLLFLEIFPLYRFYKKIINEEKVLYILRFSTLSLSAVIFNISFKNFYISLFYLVISIYYIKK